MKILPTQFDGQAIRRLYDEATDTWWFSVVDVVQVLTDSNNARRYWSDLKRKLAQEAGSEQPYAEIVQFKLPSTDGKQRETDCASAQTLLRLVQSIPSPKAEPIKLWLAKVGYERMQEIADPAQALDRARQTWQQLGRSDKWIQQRMTGQETRNKLTDYWAEHGIAPGQEFALLTNLIHQEWAGLSVAQHKAKKGLKSQNLRDHMSEAELIFTALAELSTRQIAAAQDATGLQENKGAAHAGGRIARQARQQLEAQTGQSVVTGGNYLPSQAEGTAPQLQPPTAELAHPSRKKP
ncbi:Bro-N domain-containing protein [Comamonas sp. NLF-1-9]|uniref:BRO-N domain-containing protein n=1 Tax=Comamonas sp. NLF-1-9 TaxID=2853163 RepID=UPI001C43A3EB|nr:Bro-N domain-containing protein [Comamonas sp. NLF-1-9]QXL83982.1 Bro-N domain-containing protein [Comamonas sp. NLF-1-9]